jgi:RecQ family ATP-dependent DNA helicase
VDNDCYYTIRLLQYFSAVSEHSLTPLLLFLISMQVRGIGLPLVSFFTSLSLKPVSVAAFVHRTTRQTHAAGPRNVSRPVIARALLEPTHSHSHTHYRTRTLTQKATMNVDDDQDEFGDTSFLENLDVDQVVEDRRQSLEKDDNDSPSKRLKVTATSSPPVPDDGALQKTLQETFGYNSFREGQVQVIQALLDKRDVAVFWATGQGKSLCYQIPSLHQNQVAVVVSPLISLMQDQVHKLNGLSKEPVATFLGSAQQDPQEERKALQGDYNLIYVTPEKLATAGFLNQLAQLHAHKSIALFAIDESHCVSEWGHDFRPDFRHLGKNLRDHQGLAQIPILALTATAVPRVQLDIMQSLRLRNPLKSQQSFDRTNLKIRVLKKSGGVSTAMQGLVEALNTPNVRLTKESTIVYAPTRAQVEEVALYLQKSVETAQVEAYHAGLSNDDRSRAHTNFLTGKTTVIVATVAFGMGIDKPDTRRVIHYGPPKTLEEYYQQIGRAGRDGLPAECTMYTSAPDLDRYKSEFYLGGLTGSAREATVHSMDALRSFSLDAEKCRRKSLLDYFEEVPAFGQRCGTCDTCLSVAKYQGDTQRDFSDLGARVVLRAVFSLKEQGLSQILKVVGGNKIEDYRYATGKSAPAIQQTMAAEKENLSRKYPLDYYRDLITPLVQKGYLSESSKSATVGGFQRSWTVYKVTQQGHAAFRDGSAITLPVPESVRELERKEQEKRELVLAKLEENGIKIDKLPQEEVAKGDGEVIRAYSKWHSYLENSQRSGKPERIPQLEALISVIEKWRSETAIKYRMAPGTVLAEHTLVSIAYTTATMPPGMKIDSPSLVAAGVRTRELDSLTDALGQWVDEVQPAGAGGANDQNDARMILAHISPSGGWKHAAYKPAKKTGLATWESSYNRFAEGESPPTIAMSPASGKPIQVATVVGHVLDAITHGRDVDAERLAKFLPPPSRGEWEQLQMAETSTNMDVAADPNSSGINGEKFTMTEFLRPIVGDEFVDTPFTERSQPDKDKFGHWCNRLKWYMALRRVGYEPSFSS